MRSVLPHKPVGLILCAAKAMVKTTRPDPDQRVSPAPWRHPLQQSSARVEQLAASPRGARHVPPAQRESPPAQGRTAATAHTVPRKRFQDTPTGRKPLHTTRTSEHPQHKSDGSRNLPQSGVQTGWDTAGEGKSCTATEKASPPSRVEDFMPFRTASQSFTGEGRLKAGGFSTSRRQVGPNLKEEAEKATSRKSEEARKDSELLLSNRYPGQTAWQRLCLVTCPLVVTGINHEASKTTPAVIKSHQPLTEASRGGLRVSPCQAEVLPVLEHQPDFLKDNFCHPLSQPPGSFAYHDFFGCYTQLNLTQPQQGCRPSCALPASVCATRPLQEQRRDNHCRGALATLLSSLCMVQK